MSELVIEGHKIKKTFKDFWGRPKVHAIKGIDISVPKGSIFGLLGPNGAGKSTLIKIILGHLYCTSGHMRVMGRNPRDVAIKQHIGYLPERTSFYTNLNTVETLVFFGRLLGMSDNETKRRSKQLIKMVGLENATDRLVGEFSHGMRKRLGLAQALLNDPDLLLLDEPTAGLDPIGCREIKDLILTLGKRGKTILMTSHLLGDVQDVCDQIMIVYGGKVQASGEITTLLAKTDELLVRSPVVSNDTISRVTEALKNEVTEENISISYPTRTLEDYFISIVVEATKRNEGTAGAQMGMGVADYLSSALEATEPKAPEAKAQPPVEKPKDTIKPSTPAEQAPIAETKDEPKPAPEPAIQPPSSPKPELKFPQPPVVKEQKEPSKAPSNKNDISELFDNQQPEQLKPVDIPQSRPSTPVISQPTPKDKPTPVVTSSPKTQESLESARAIFGDGYEPEDAKEIDYKTLNALTRKR